MVVEWFFNDKPIEASKQCQNVFFLTQISLFKNGRVPQKFLFVIFFENVAFLEKNVKWKNIQNLVSHKKGYIHFRCQTSPSLQKGFGLRNGFSPFSRKIQLSIWGGGELLNNKIFSTSFVIKKRVRLIFGARRSHSLKMVRCVPEMVFSENTTFFLKNCCIKKYSTSNLW